MNDWEIETQDGTYRIPKPNQMDELIGAWTGTPKPQQYQMALDMMNAGLEGGARLMSDNPLVRGIYLGARNSLDYPQAQYYEDLARQYLADANYMHALEEER